MICDWLSLLNVLPAWLREKVDKLGRAGLLELRLRIGCMPQLILKDRAEWLDRQVMMDDLNFCINAASHYSPWAAATAADGYITAPGGHRIGMCGNAAIHNDQITGITGPTSLCIRVARDYPGISRHLKSVGKSLLIIGKPGSGKTTLLRDLIRQKSDFGTGSICVVDEKRELFPVSNGQGCFSSGRQTDVLSGCSKADGIEMLLRNMGPNTIAVDEITAEEDCRALLHAGWCGVNMIATAHAGCRDDLYSRPIYRSIISSNIFDALIVMRDDKSWTLERMN